MFSPILSIMIKRVTYFDTPFVKEEFELVFYSSNKKSSPGPDQIDYKILSHLPESYRSTLLSILNDIFQKGDFPEDWKSSIVYMIPKSTPGKFRPISLTLCLLKMLERLVLLRLNWRIKSKHILPEFQFGFRSFKSCQDNLSIFTSEIHTSFVRSHVTVCLFLDLPNAFDDVLMQLLLSDLLNCVSLFIFVNLCFN